MDGFLDTPAGPVPRVATTLSVRDRLETALTRIGYGRNDYKVVPGLYCVGDPTPESPVLVTANYKLTFDSVRGELSGTDAWLLVADTRGINVWCAAGKGLFSTEEVVYMVNASRLAEVVTHREIILPQLSATGVAARRVRRKCGFSAIFGPVRASDLPAYLRAGNQADEAMRAVTFTLRERAVLTPVELYLLGKPLLIILAAGFLLSGIGPDLFSLAAAWTRGLAVATATLFGVLTGCVAVPLALDRLPGRSFALKGAGAGAVAGLAAAGLHWSSLSTGELAATWLWTVTLSTYLGLNFTGSTPYTSPTGVETEMRRALPVLAVAVLVAVAVWVAAPFTA